MQRLAVVWLLILAATLCLLRCVFAEPPRFTVTLLEPKLSHRKPNNVCDSGMVAAQGKEGGGVYHALLWKQGSGFTDLGTLDGYPAGAVDVNDFGEVVGFYQSGDWSRAFLWQAETGMVDLGTFGGGMSRARAINNMGQVVGESRDMTAHFRAFLWEEGSGMKDLGTLGWSGSGAYDINEKGQIVGGSEPTTPPHYVHAVIWNPGESIKDLGTLGGTQSLARAINDKGQIAGDANTAGSVKPRAVIWQPDLSIVDLGVLPGATSGWANDINDAGQVVGITGGTGFLWEAEYGMVDLRDLVEPPRVYGIADAVSINNRGWILATAWFAGIYYPALLKPILTVETDIKPGSTRNPINPRSNGSTPVAILASDALDLRTIDLSTVELSGAPIARRPNGSYMAEMEDVNDDGRADLVIQIITNQMNLQPGDTKASLEAATYDGQRIVGEDSVVVVGAK